MISKTPNSKMLSGQMIQDHLLSTQGLISAHTTLFIHIIRDLLPENNRSTQDVAMVLSRYGFYAPKSTLRNYINADLKEVLSSLQKGVVSHD